MMYQLNLRSCGSVVHRDQFEADDHEAAVEVAGAVFHGTSAHWDSYDLWQGGLLVASTIGEKFNQLADQVERAAVAIEESMRRLNRFANDEKLAGRIREIRERHKTASP